MSWSFPPFEALANASMVKKEARIKANVGALQAKRLMCHVSSFSELAWTLFDI